VRHVYWSTPDSRVVDSFGNLCAGVPVKVYAAQRGGNAIVDLVYVDSAGNPNGAVPGGVLVSDGDGLIPSFAGPDGGSTTVWGNHGIGGTRVALTADPVGSGGGGSTGPHAGTHTLGGSDPVTVAQTQVAGLPAALAGKAALTHAATHASGGADPVTVAQGQVTGLTTALTAKADLVGGLIPTSQMPPLAINTITPVADQAAMLALTAQRGDGAIRADNGKTYILATDSPSTLGDWKEILAVGSVVSVAGKTGVVALTAGDITTGVFDIARLPVGATSSTVTVGNDSRFTTLTTTDVALAARIAALEAGSGTPGPGVTIPGAPTGATAQPGIRQAGVSFVPPASDGGAAITSYKVTASTGQTATGTGSPILVTGLTAGVAVTFTVAATNSAGTGPASAPSSPVTPSAPPTAPGAPAYVHDLGSAERTTSGTTITVTTTATAATGNAILLAICCNGDPGNVTVQDSAANTYGPDGFPVANGSATSVVIYSARLVNTLPAGSTITVTFGTARNLASVQAHEFSGLPTTAPEAIGVGTANAATALTTAAMTTTVGNDLVFAAFAMASNGTTPDFTPGTGWTPAGSSQAVSGGSSRDLYTEWRVKDPAGTVTGTATVGTAKNYAGIALAYPPVDIGGGNGSGATGTYNTFLSAQAAASIAVAGDVITLAGSTTYAGKMELVDLHGTSTAPIVITGPRTAVLDAGNKSSGYGLYMDRCSWVTVRGFRVTNAQKGIMVDRSTNCVIEDMEVDQIGMEGIHLRNETTYCKVRDNEIHDTGQVRADFGEGLYCGTANSNLSAVTRLPAAMYTFPDHSDFNEFTGNNIFNVTAECMDAKEGTVGCVLSGNTFNGSMIAGANFADSWVDIKGEGWTVTGNTGTTIMTDGYQTHRISMASSFTQASGYTDGLGVHHPPVKSGSNNTFDANTSHCSPATGYGFWIDSNTSGNLVYTNNIVDGAAAGRCNVGETVKAATVWLSGVGESYATVAAWTAFRGEATTYARVWADSDMNNMLNLYAMEAFTNAGWDGVLDLAVGGPSNWATAATGAFDATWRAQCQKALSLWGNLRALHLSMAHEFNNGYAWEVSAGEQANFKTAWSRWYQIVQDELVAHGKNARVVLSCNSDTNSGWTVAAGMPNLAHIDIIGCDFYSMYPTLTDDGIWDANKNTMKGDTPRGIQAWLDFAAAKGKPISFPEWGVSPSNAFNPNNPYFVEKMRGVFAANMPADPYNAGPGKIAGEAYFNAYAGQGKIWPTSTGNPDVATKYVSLVWGS
jgi:hypothetical protein